MRFGERQVSDIGNKYFGCRYVDSIWYYRAVHSQYGVLDDLMRVQ